jgi:hypothetical protein
MRTLEGSVVLLSIALSLLQTACAAEPGMWKAGVATQRITPSEPMWMAGYGHRNRPAEGKLTELYLKALALEDGDGRRLVLLTSDLVGIPRHLSEEVAAAVRRRTGLPRERLLLTCSHTHCGPVLRDSLHTMYNMPPELAARVEPYTRQVRDWMIAVILRALENLEPALLAHGKGTVRFAVNRRKPTAQGFINAANPEGPVDHDVPVLRVSTPRGKLLAVVFSYACHNTTLQLYQWCGDYAGYAQQRLEQKHQGAVAFFCMGCGGDANPLPRSTVELCQKYGRELARAVEDVLDGTIDKIGVVPSTARYSTVALPFAHLPSREELARQRASKEFALRRRAEELSKQLEQKGRLDADYPSYPVQVWQLGELTWVALGGEVVVDYSLRLKRELGKERPLWVIAYANDVMAYIPSERVLAEGGYEGDTSMIYYGLPSKWAAGIEKRIVSRAHELVQAVRTLPEPH